MPEVSLCLSKEQWYVTECLSLFSVGRRWRTSTGSRLRDASPIEMFCWFVCYFCRRLSAGNSIDAAKDERSIDAGRRSTNRTFSNRKPRPSARPRLMFSQFLLEAILFVCLEVLGAMSELCHIGSPSVQFLHSVGVASAKHWQAPSLCHRLRRWGSPRPVHGAWNMPMSLVTMCSLVL